DEITFMTPVVYHERIDEYKKIVTEPLKRVERERRFLPNNEYTYFRRVNGEPQQFSGSFSESFLRERTFLESYRKKRPIHLLSIDELQEVAKEVDEKLNDGTNDWQLRLDPLSLQQSF